MMIPRVRDSLLAILFIQALCLGLEVPETVKSYSQVFIKHRPEALILIEPKEGISRTATDKPDITAFVAPPAKYRVQEIYTGEDKVWVVNEAFVTIGEPGPEPPPTPDPNPEPKPEPEPNPNPEGISKADRLRVMMIYETEDLNTEGYPLGSIRSTTADIYLNGACDKLPTMSGKTLPAWRRWDDDMQDSQLTMESAEMIKLFKRAKRDSQSHGNQPWMVLVDKNGIHSQKIPADENEFISVLTSYGGP